MVEGVGGAFRFHQTQVFNGESNAGNSLNQKLKITSAPELVARKLRITHRTIEGSSSANPTDEARADTCQLERQLNRNLVPYHQFEEQHTSLKTKAQRHLPDHATTQSQ
jgi:hypothetical protein